MSKRNLRLPITQTIGLAFCLLCPSIGLAEKYGGMAGLAAYIVVALSLLILACRLGLPMFLSNVTEKQAIVLALITFLGLIALFLILYPIAQSGALGGGSDGDDALDLGATALMHGRYPYYQKTYLGNLISPLPGALFFAVPFVALGRSAYQSLFWLACFFFAVRAYYQSSATALALVWIMLALSPVVLQNVVVGVDYLANSIYVLLFMWWAAACIPRYDLSIWKKVLPSVLLGIALSSRSNFIFNLPPLFSFLVQNAGWKQAIKYAAVTCLSLLAVTIPFWLYAPDWFAPLSQQPHKLERLQAILPKAVIVIPLASFAVSLALSFKRMGSDPLVLFRNCAIVQAVPALAVLSLSTMISGGAGLVFASFGIFFMFFGAMPCWDAVLKPLRIERQHNSPNNFNVNST
ncbi:MAG: hypothetical protein WCB68_07245 [Pyrinomonadaceae bacterium]